VGSDQRREKKKIEAASHRSHMNRFRITCCRALILIALGGLLSGGRAASPPEPNAEGAPQVLKIDPPNWWVGHSINPVLLLIRGRNLSHARVELEGAGFRASNVHSNAAGSYLFLDLTIDRNSKPGRRSIKLINAAGSADFTFDVLAPLSRHGRFQGFSPDDFIYEIMPDRFSNGDPSNDNPPQSPGLLDRSKPRYYHGGDLQGIINHLSYLKQLGATALWLTPIYGNVNHLNERERYDNQAVTDYHGYGAVDFYAVEEHFGDLAKLRELVDDAHKLGIKVIQDEVANHTGPYHPWVQDPPTPTWYHGSEAAHADETWQTWTLIDPHAPPQLRRATLDGWFINILPDLNQDDPEVGRYLIQNTLWWIGIVGFDAIREDTLPYVPRRFWHDWMAAIKREYPRVNVVGEVYDGDPAITSFFQGGKPRFDGVDSGVDAVFDFPLLYPVRRAFAEGKSLRETAVMLAHDYLYPNPNLLVTFIGNHDMPRFMNEPGASIAGLKLALTFIMTTRGVPMIYSGDEIAMPGGGDPDNRRDFPGGWPGDLHNAFEASGRTPDEEAAFEHVSKLAQLRTELEPLRRGKLVDLDVGDQIYAYARLTDRQSVVVIINNGVEGATVEFDGAPARLSNGTTLTDRLGKGPPLQVRDGKIRATLPQRTVSVYVPKNPP
jgi:glycosidase